MLLFEEAVETISRIATSIRHASIDILSATLTERDFEESRDLNKLCTYACRYSPSALYARETHGSDTWVETNAAHERVNVNEVSR